MKYFAALIVIAFAVSSSMGQEIDCTEELFRVSRREGSCVDFFVCMIGGRVDFSCDPGDIFDEDRIMCRPGDAETCEFTIPQIPGDFCNNNFNTIHPHPDPEQCWRFFTCLNYSIIEFRCQAGTIFSGRENRCVPGDWRTCREDDFTPYDIFLKNFGHKLRSN